MDYRDFLKRLEQAGWTIEQNDASAPQLDEILLARLGHASTNLEELISAYTVCSNKQDDVWFLSWADFAGMSDSSFRWNEFELQSLDAAIDEQQRKAVTDFWSGHIPFLMSVRSGYAYAAISIESASIGKIVVGNEPEYELVDVLSDSFEDFLKLFAEAVDGAVLDPRLSPFI